LSFPKKQCTNQTQHSTNLKDRILENVPGLQAHRQVREVTLAFNDDVGQALKNLNDPDVTAKQ